MTEYRVLVLEDEHLTAQTYVDYLTRLGGFEVVNVAHSVRSALAFLHHQQRNWQQFRVDLVLLDMHLPDGHGLDVLRQLRTAGFAGDVIAMTAATEVPTIRQAMSLGVVQYLVKPFGFAEFTQRIEVFRNRVERLNNPHAELTQSQIDEALAAPPSTARTNAALPKGLSEASLATMVEVLSSSEAALSAGEAAQLTGSSRVTARRYLEYLHRLGNAEKTQRYGVPGRPEYEYRWISPDSRP